MTNGRRATIGSIAGVVLLAFFGTRYFLAENRKETSVLLLDPAKVVVLRTPGGMLEVATLVRNEEFGWTSKRACPVIDCGKLLGATTTRIRLPVHYTYRLPLGGTWTLHPQNGSYVLDVPAEELSLPPAADLSHMEIQTTRGWFSPSTTANRERLLRELEPELRKRALQPSYVDAQREQARKTVAEFARKWMQEQQAAPSADIRVRFADEGSGSS